MELDRRADDGVATRAVTPSGPGQDAGRLPAEPSTALLDPETTTSLLRRCTALATRARVELLTPGRRAAADELESLLGTMGTWAPGSLDRPDPTMTVLCAAALQDLAERLDDSASAPLAARIDAVLGLLRAVMRDARVDVPA
ncbi:hypothetical protein ACT3SP_02830 [Brachybacterium sp. AOP43-C2-M15]|uniref:hypothetical protein n=1 Tax=Brachybacterium sp. AOP43-C2-M15 TaxID=3457661 RepID=UPI004034D7BC